MLVAAMALDRYPAVQCPGTGVVMADRYDTLVIGGGMAGLPLALRAARHGRVAFVEKKNLAEPA
jgi:glycerol-3-phosphate dehydrogenase